MATQQKFNVAIVGGGVCGLTLAAGLQKRGLKAHIYESAVSLRAALDIKRFIQLMLW